MGDVCRFPPRGSAAHRHSGTTLEECEIAVAAALDGSLGDRRVARIYAQSLINQRRNKRTEDEREATDEIRYLTLLFNRVIEADEEERLCIR